MIQNIEPKIFYNQFGSAQAAEGDYVFVFSGNRVLVKEAGDELDFIRYGELDKKEREFTYLFAVDEQRYFLLVGEEELFIPGYVYRTMHEIRPYGGRHQVLAAATAWHLHVWYRDNRFCGRCGAKTVHDEKERALRCPVCKNMIFPKIAPAVIVGVIDGSRILLTKYAHRQYKRYALIAGFTEIGETAEETVRREVLEEVGLHVKNIRYYKSQPWGFDSNLLLGFFCELDDTKKIHMDEDELALAEWVEREDIPDYGENLSLTHEMMVVFKKKKFRESGVDGGAI